MDNLKKALIGGRLNYILSSVRNNCNKKIKFVFSFISIKFLITLFISLLLINIVLATPTAPGTVTIKDSIKSGIYRISS